MKRVRLYMGKINLVNNRHLRVIHSKNLKYVQPKFTLLVICREYIKQWQLENYISSSNKTFYVHNNLNLDVICVSRSQ